MRKPRRPSPGLIVAVVALIAALGGSAIALPGRNSVQSDDLKRGSVTKRAIKSKAVTSAKLAGAESPHVLGAQGEPPFDDGGDGDCEWSHASETLVPGIGPVSFYKDPFDRVYISGIAIQEHDTGGDGDCGDTSTTDNSRDQVVFILPPAYRPEEALIDETAGGANVVAGDEPFALTSPLELPIPAGGVAVSSDPGGPGFLEGLSFRAGSGGAAKQGATGEAPARLAPGFPDL